MDSQEFRFTRAQLRGAIQDSFSRLAGDPAARMHYDFGRTHAISLGYDERDIDQFAYRSIQAFAGVGNPFSIRPILPGEVVVDIGSGSGSDACIASGLVGPIGNVFGVEMTDEMLSTSREQVRALRCKNITFTKAYAEKIPLPDQMTDVVISNGVINLCPNKDAVFREIYRILKPAGRVQIADIIVEKEIGPHAREQVHLWTDCIAGSITESEYRAILAQAGFKNITIGNYLDVFANAPIAERAAQFGAKGAHIYAEK